MTSTCPTCHRPLPEGAARNDRRTVSIEIPEDVLPLMVEVMRDSNNRYVMHGHGEIAGRLRGISDAVHEAKPEELRAFSPNGWARALEGISKGYDVRIETVPARSAIRNEPLKGKTTIRLRVEMERRGKMEDVVLAEAHGRDEQDVPGIVAYIEDAFERWRPMR